MMASKYSSAYGRSATSAWIGMILLSKPASLKRAKFSLAVIHRSVANTCTPNSLARNMDVRPLPQPRSRTRIWGFSSSIPGSWVNSSRIFMALGPIILSSRNCLSYVCDLGYFIAKAPGLSPYLSFSLFSILVSSGMN